MRVGYTTGIVAKIFLQVSRLIQCELNTLISGFKLNLGIYATLRFNPVVKDQPDISCTYITFVLLTWSGEPGKYDNIRELTRGNTGVI